MSDQPPVNVNVNPPPEPSITIGLREVYNEVRAMSSKLDALPGAVGDHEVRIRSLEANTVTKAAARWIVGALLTAIVAGTGVVALIIR